MRKLHSVFFLVSLVAVIACNRPSANDHPSASIPSVKIAKTASGFRLERHGKPFFIKGAGGYSRFDRLSACGGNSVRVWETSDAERILNRAQELGITVNLGLWIGRELEGFDYYNQQLVDDQFEKIRKTVLQFRNHPALLLWCVGNEWNSAATNIKVFDEVNRITKMIHELDPDHPVTTTIMLTTARPISIIRERCPELDILSLNTYGALHALKSTLVESGWDKPYIVSEYGPKGYWEADFTPWEVPIEQTSNEKVIFIEERYHQHILSDTANCFGAYVFQWGQKQERTPTWFSFFGEGGEETPMIGLMEKLWKGGKPANQAPELLQLRLDQRSEKYLSFAGTDSLHVANVIVRDPDGDTLRYQWEILHESNAHGKEGAVYLEKKPEVVTGLFVDASGPSLRFRIPAKPGPYRIYVYVFDGHNHVATANFPIFVKAPQRSDYIIPGELTKK